MHSLVIPVYQNEANLDRLLAEVVKLASRVPGGMEVVFVVDGSPDRCLQILRERLPLLPLRTQLVSLSRNFGSFAAIAAGLERARGSSMAVMAADLQEPPELVLQFFRYIEPEIEEFEQVTDSFIIVLYTIEGCPELQKLQHLHPVVHAGIGGHIAGSAADFFGITHYIQAKNGCATRGGKDQVKQDPDGGRFPSAIGADKTKDISLFDIQGKVINSPRTAIGFCKMVDFDDVHTRLNSGTTGSKGTPN